MKHAFLLLLLLAGCSKAEPATKPEESKPKEVVLVEASVPEPVASARVETACTKDEECTRAPTCCPHPCPAAIHEKDVEKAIAAMKCPPNITCPSAGACRTHRYQCASGKCQLVFKDQ